MEISEKKKRKRSDLIAINNGSAAAIRKVESTYITKGDETSPSSKPPPPSEEEVEEFFSIIRRMRVAPHDLQLQGSVCERISVDDHVKNWTTVLSDTDLRRQINCNANRSGDMRRREEEKEVINDPYHETTVVGRSNEVIVMNGVRKLDLNAVPIEAETNIYI